jgi:thioredoxin 1
MAERHSGYQQTAPAIEAVQAMRGLVLLDFGTDWCGHCQAALAAVDGWVAANPGVVHLRIEDGRGKPLGRAYRVKLWPTLVLLRDGEEVARVVRPRERRYLHALELASGP